MSEMVKAPTEYRIVSDGIFFFLEYKVWRKGFFFDSESWENVWRPFCETWGGRNNGLDIDLFVTSYSHDLNEFVKRWPNINDYLRWANDEQQTLENKAMQARLKYEDRKKSIRYL